LNSTADRTLNFSVAGQVGFSPSISGWDINNNISVGGLTVGFEYIISYSNPNGNGGSFSFDAFSSTMGFNFNSIRYSQVCVVPKCGSGATACRQF
jgi:hypothetical protein